MYKILQCDADQKRQITLDDLIEIADMFDKDGVFTCDKCGKHTNELFLTDRGRLCEACKKESV